jgi:hypothetical protein
MEIQTLRIFTLQFSIERVSISASLKISKHLYTNIFYRVSQQCIDINWTRDGIQFSVDNPYLVLLTVADIDTAQIDVYL